MLKDPDVFVRATTSIPLLRRRVDLDTVEACTDVLTMAGLRNSLRSYDPALVIGFVPVGDAYCHTDPVLAHGLSFGLIHAAALAAALREHEDLGDACKSYAAAIGTAIRERYDFATNLDEQRLRMWVGEPVDFASPDARLRALQRRRHGVAVMASP